MADYQDVFYNQIYIDVKTAQQGYPLWIPKKDAGRAKQAATLRKTAYLLVHELVHLERYELIGWIGSKAFWIAATLNTRIPHDAWEVPISSLQPVSYLKVPRSGRIPAASSRRAAQGQG